MTIRTGSISIRSDPKTGKDYYTVNHDKHWSEWGGDPLSYSMTYPFGHEMTKEEQEQFDKKIFEIKTLYPFVCNIIYDSHNTCYYTVINMGERIVADWNWLKRYYSLDDLINDLNIFIKNYEESQK